MFASTLFGRGSRSRSLVVRTIASGILFLSMAPSGLGATYTADVLTTADAQAVTRGDFVRAAVKTLGIETGKATPVPGVPTSLAPYARVADSKKALAAFGAAFDPAKPITRGQAIQVLAALTGLAPAKELTAKYADVKTPEARAAVSLAVEFGWLKPTSTRIFGMDRTLSGREGRLLLQRLVRSLPQENHESTGLIPVKVRVNSVPTPVPKSDVLEAVWNLLNDQYLYRDRIDAEKASNKAIQGLVDSLNDPYTVYLPRSSSQRLQNQLKGEVEGIGATVEQTGGLLRIVTPLPGSPAEKAGLLPKDQILSADGMTLGNLSLDDAVSHIRGPKGSKVLLRVRRDGVEFDVTVTRETVRIPEIEVTYQDDIAIVKIYQFGQTTDSGLRAKLSEMMATKRLKGLVLDLRNNPGGLLHAAQVTVGNFVPKGTAYVSINSRGESHIDYTTETPTVDATVRMVVLVNKGSASASEIVAGALQDAKRATLVGEKSYGKGTVQQLVEFNDGSSLKLTIAEWKTPLGRKIDALGIEPDVTLAKGDRDDQMVKAVEILRR